MQDFKPIKNHEQYLVNKQGKVYSLKTNKFLIGKIDKDGYREFHFKNKGKHKYFRGHRLVAETFIPNPNNLPCVNHKNGDKLNNNIDNLEWCTVQQNNWHSCHILGNKPIRYGDKPVSSYNILTQETQNFVSMSECARHFKVHVSSIYNRLSNKQSQPVLKRTKLQYLVFKFI